MLLSKIIKILHLYFRQRTDNNVHKSLPVSYSRYVTNGFSKNDVRIDTVHKQNPPPCSCSYQFLYILIAFLSCNIAQTGSKENDMAFCVPRNGKTIYNDKWFFLYL